MVLLFVLQKLDHVNLIKVLGLLLPQCTLTNILINYKVRKPSNVGCRLGVMFPSSEGAWHMLCGIDVYTCVLYLRNCRYKLGNPSFDCILTP